MTSFISKLARFFSRNRIEAPNFEFTLSNAPLILWSIDRAGIFRFSEGAGLRTRGLKRGDRIGNSIYEVYKSYPDIVESVHRALAGEKVILENEIDSDWYETTFNPIHSKNNQVTGVVGVSVNITERIQTTRKLRELSEANAAFEAERKSASALKLSEARTRAIFNSAFDAIVGMDCDGLISDWNPKAEEIFGWQKNEAIGMRLSELIMPKEYREAHEQGMRSYLKTKTTKVLNRSFEITALRRNGETFPIELSISPVQLDDGFMFTAFIADVTERKKFELEKQVFEEKLKETSSRLETIVRVSPLAILTVDLDCIVKLWNPACERIFGWKAGEAIGEFLPFVPKNGRDDSKARMTKLGEFREPLEFEAERVRKDGVVILIRVYAVPLIDGDGNVYGFMSISKDITERAKEIEDLKLARAQAEAATKAKSEFLANMSHEIRTPINGVMGMTSLLLDTQLSPEQRDYSETIQSSADTLLTIVNDILDLSKAEAGKIDLEIIDFELESVVLDIERTLSFAAKRKGLKLFKSISTDLPHFLNGDPTRLRQVLLNLVNNAIKFTPHGQVTIEAYALRESKNSITVKFEITDTGVGIPEKALERMFQAFSQADSSTTRRFGGTGLGLSISKHLVQLMDGDIGVTSTPQKGSTFWFTVELKRAAQDKLRSPDQVVIEPQKSLARLRILLAEDNSVNQLIAIKMLQKMGHAVVAVANGVEALDSLRDAPYDLILMDCQMPEMDGYQTTTIIRTSPNIQQSNIPIIAMTANAMAGDRERCLKVGMTDYISKPMKAGDLANIIGRNFPGETKVS